MRFGDVVELVSDTVRDAVQEGIDRYIAMEHLEPGSLHIRTWGDLSEGTTFTKRCRPGQVLFGKRRAYQRKVAIAEFDAVVSGDIYVFQAKADRLDPMLLPFLCMSERFFQFAVETSAGSLSPRTNWSHLAEFEFALPPLDQQHRIAELLWAVDEAGLRATTVLHALAQLKRTTRDRFCEADSSTVPLGSVLTYLSDGPFGSKLKTEHYSDSGARVVRLQNIGLDTFDDSDKAYIPASYYEELRRYRVSPGDIIVGGLGDDTHKVGRAVIVPESFGLGINKSDCLCLRANPIAASNEYVAHYLNSSIGFERVSAVAQGTTRLRVNGTNLKKIVITVPSLAAQDAFIHEMTAIEEGLTTARSHVGNIKGLGLEILNELF